MADGTNSEKTIQISLKTASSDFQQIDTMLKRLSAAANTLADAFSRMSGTSQMQSLSAGGVANPTATQNALRTPPTGRYSLPIIGQMNDLHRHLNQALPSVSRFRDEYSKLMDTLNTPLPEGAAAVLEAVRGLGGAATPSRTGTGTVTPVTPSGGDGGDGTPGGGGRGGGGRRGGGRRRAEDDDGEEGGDPSISWASRTLSRMDQRANIVKQGVAQVYNLATMSQRGNLQSLTNLASISSLENQMMLGDVYGDFNTRMAISQMGGIEKIRRDYGTATADRRNTAAAAGIGLVGMIGAGAALMASPFTGGGSLLLGGAALGGGALFGSSVMDLYAGGPEARSEANVRAAIEEQKRTDPYAPFIQSMGARSFQLLQQSRQLNRAVGVGPATNLYPEILRSASLNVMDPDFVGQEMSTLGRLTDLRSRGGRGRNFGLLQEFMNIARGGYSLDELNAPLTTMYNRTGESPEAIVSTASRMAPPFMAERLIQATSQLSRSDFGFSNQATVMSMLSSGGGAANPERLGIRAQAFQGLQADASKSLPYMVKLQRINEKLSDIQPWQRVALAQMGPADLASPEALKRIGLSADQIKRVQAENLSGLSVDVEFGRFLDPTTGVGKRVQELGGSVSEALPKMTSEEIGQVAAARKAFSMGGDLEVFREELKIERDLPKAAKGFSGRVGEKGATEFQDAAEIMIKARVQGETVALNRLASELSKILQQAGLSINALVSKGGATGKTVGGGG